jgi:hypothetical protein
MSRYRKADQMLWCDEKFRALSDDGKLVFLLVLLHPNMTAVGAMRGSVVTLAEDLDWEVERLSKGFEEAFQKGLVEHDRKARFVGLPNFLKYNAPENPNVLKSWVSAYEMLPECNLKLITLQRLERLSESLSPPFAKAFQQAFGKHLAKGMPKQEQEQEPKQEQRFSSQEGGTEEEGSSAGTVVKLPVGGGR